MSLSTLEMILNLEWAMFSKVRSSSPAACQSAPERFKAIRGRLFDVWTEEMRMAYLADLEAATTAGRNLLSEKYARMDNLIPGGATNPLIERIVAIESGWQAELRQRVPALYERCCRRTDPTGDGSDFAVYLRSELETYGERTVELYYENVLRAEEAGINLGREALEGLVRQGGYRDLEHAERHLRGLASVP